MSNSDKAAQLLAMIRETRDKELPATSASRDWPHLSKPGFGRFLSTKCYKKQPIIWTDAEIAMRSTRLSRRLWMRSRNEEVPFVGQSFPRGGLDRERKS